MALNLTDFVARCTAHSRLVGCLVSTLFVRVPLKNGENKMLLLRRKVVGLSNLSNEEARSIEVLTREVSFIGAYTGAYPLLLWQDDDGVPRLLNTVEFVPVDGRAMLEPQIAEQDGSPFIDFCMDPRDPPRRMTQW